MPQPQIDCYSEFLPTASYLGPLHFRLTARDGHPAGGGIESSDTTISLAPGTGPFLVTSHGAGGTVDGHAPVTVTWDVAGTNLPPIADGEREDQHVRGRRLHVSARARREHAERRLGGRVGGERRHGEGAAQGRGGRQRLLRPQRRRLRDPGRRGRDERRAARGRGRAVQRRALADGHRLGDRPGHRGLRPDGGRVGSADRDDARRRHDVGRAQRCPGRGRGRWSAPRRPRPGRTPSRSP